MMRFNRGQPDGAALVGRDDERRALREILSEVLAGRGQLVLIGGEAGIGKTTLVEHFTPEASNAGATVLTGACYDAVSTPPYAPWTEALRPNAALSDGTGVGAKSLWFEDVHLTALPDQTALFADVWQRLANAARENPLVIILEDLHWADQESLELLRFFGRSLNDVPMLIIGTYRSDELSARTPLYHVLPQLVREARAVRFDLRRFPPDSIRDLVLQRYRLDPGDRERLVDYLARRTEGNPFFIEELLRTLENAGALASQDGVWTLGSLSDVEIPLLIRQVIDRRFLQLDDATRSALQVASVLGYEVRTDLWLSAIDEDETGLARIVQQALDAHLLEQSPYSSHLRFRHALVREALYASLPLPLRQLQHRRIASVLAETPGADPATVAEHFRRAGDRKAAGWLLRAARQARQLYAPHAILQHLNSAVEGLDTLTHPERMEAFRLRGWAHEISGEFEAAQRDYQLELRAARESGDQRAECDALMRLAELWAGRDYERTSEYVEQALRHAEQMGDASLRAHSLNRLGNWYLNGENPERSRQYHEEALKIFQDLGDQRGIADTYDLLGMACFMAGDLIEGTGHYERAVDLFQSLDNRQGLASSLANLSMRGATYQTDTMVSARTTLDDCVADAERALDVAAEIDWRAGEAYALIRLGFCLGSRGDYQAALDITERAVAMAEEIGHRQWLTAACCLGGTLHLDLLDPESARGYLERGRAVAEETGSRHWIRSTSGLLALACLESGDVDDAEAELRPALAGDIPARTLAQRLAWCARIELELAQGEHEKAMDLVDYVIASSPHASRERPPVRLAMFRARALTAFQRYDEAECWLRPARRIVREQGARPALWRLHREMGLVLTARGHRLAAANQFVEARRLIEETADTLEEPSARLRFRSAALGQIPEGWTLTPLQAAKQSFGGLTRRQREVAALIAAGNSNRSIADQLSISERTVESHVSAILATLSLESRAQIAAWAVENGLAGKARE